MSTYTTGTGQKIVGVHAETKDCQTFGCSIHNPTDPNKDTMPTHWRGDRGLMERICEHGVGHPDQDHLNWLARTYGVHKAYDEGVHGCDGCCGRTEAA